MVVRAGVVGDMDASQVQLSPHLPSFPTECQLFVQECLSAVLLQRVNLPCCLDTIQHLHYSCPALVVASVTSRLALPLRDNVHFKPDQPIVCTYA